MIIKLRALLALSLAAVAILTPAGLAQGLIASAATAGAWSPTGSMVTARYDHGMAKLQDGRVLVTGGRNLWTNSIPLTSTELYNPSTGSWTVTGSLNTGRMWFGNVVTLSNGKVLIAGGTDSSGQGDYSTAELYDPALGTWTYTGSMNRARRNATLTLLNDGRVLVTAGSNGPPDGNRFLASAEIYDPGTGIWTYTGSLNTAREGHTAIRLADGRVLIAGGEGPWYVANNTAELYNPSTGTWSMAGTLYTGGGGWSMTLLNNSKVLVAGGYNGTFFGNASLYDPSTGTWTATNAMNTARAGHTASLLLDGRVLITGGNNSSPAKSLSSSEIYDPTSGNWAFDANLQVDRNAHMAAGLPYNRVLIAGGWKGDPSTGPLASSEVYSPSGGSCTSSADTDGDGLLDGWENCGYDADGDGVIDVNLPAMGANRLKKDVFVEIDYMIEYKPCQSGLCIAHSHRPKDAAITQVVQAYANAPVSNPDGSTGISLHVQISEAIPHLDTLQSTTESWDWSGFDKIKNTQGHFDPKRARIFHYAIFAHDIGGNVPIGTSGISRNDSSSDTAFRQGASDFIVSLGQWTAGLGSVNEQAGTFMHELGHNLGLRHGGDDHQNFEPNFLSVMNYSFQMKGLILNGNDGNLDYSRFGAIPSLDEAHLNETVGLNGGSAISNYGTRYYCRPFGILLNVRVTNANGSVNWDCWLGSGGVDVQANINDGNPSHADSTISVLAGFDDWSALVFDGGLVGTNSPYKLLRPLPTQNTPTDELTPDVDSQIYVPYQIDFRGASDVVGSLGVSTAKSITVTNTGGLTSTVSLGHSTLNSGWFDFSSMPISRTLVSGESFSFPVTITLPSSRSGAVSNSATISGTVQESSQRGDVAVLNARIGPLAQFAVSSTTGKAPLTVAFTDGSVGAVTNWLWSFGDGTGSALQNPVHVYTKAGTYSVTLGVIGPDGSNSIIAQKFITVSSNFFLPIITR